MIYKILYIEDQNPDSIISRIKESGRFEVCPIKPNSIDDVLDASKNVDLVLLDFKLTEESKIRIDAPTIASAFRTNGSESHIDIPIVLISTRKKITSYYKDFSNKNLFDFTATKDVFAEDYTKDNFVGKLVSAIEAYKRIKSNKGNHKLILDLPLSLISELDFRIEMSLGAEPIANDSFAYSNFIVQNIIRSVGVLIGKDVLSARLGVSIESKDWNKLIDCFESFKYKGIYGSSYERWWAEGLTRWFNEKCNLKGSLRRLSSTQRCDMIKKATGINELNPIEPIEKDGYKAKSTNFWTVCKYTKKAIDPIDGFEIYEKQLHPWQEKEYISFLGISSDYYKFLKPSDKSRVREIEKELRK